jgi:hypothetical protein
MGVLLAHCRSLRCLPGGNVHCKLKANINLLMHWQLQINHTADVLQPLLSMVWVQGNSF